MKGEHFHRVHLLPFVNVTSSGIKVRKTLESIGAVTAENVVKFSGWTREREVPVFRDAHSVAIFID